MWGNLSDEISGSGFEVTYSDIMGGYTGTGNIDEDPCFVVLNSATGEWTDNASYDGSECRSTLTDSDANWVVNELAGKFINPDTINQYLQFLIVSNDVNTVTVLGDVTGIAGAGDSYEIFDYHLSYDSKCMDAGDPDFEPEPNETDIDGEKRVVDGDGNGTLIVDMGADEYYWSPADFNLDEIVNFFDYALFADAWQATSGGPDYNDIYDLTDSNCIDCNDLAVFCEDWLWQPAWGKTFVFVGRGMGGGFGFGGGNYPTAEARPAVSAITEADIDELVRWLEELWLTNEEVRKTNSEAEWLSFIETVEKSKYMSHYVP